MSDMKSILWLAVEDYAGLWEVAWELRAVHPEASDRDLRREARVIVTYLVDSGWVELYRCMEPYGEVSLIPESEKAAVLANDSSWREPVEEASSVRMSATSSGEEVYASWSD